MKTRTLRPQENELWRQVALSVTLAPGRAAPPEPPPEAPQRAGLKAQSHPPAERLAARRQPPPARVVEPPSPDAIEPGRHRRIARGREPIGARLDLHGLDQARAHRVLVDFLIGAQSRGARAVLIITGKGMEGRGVLRRRAPEWLADPALRPVVAGLAPAEHQHGGEGALYVALKRRAR